MPMSVTYTTINGEVIAENRGGVRKQYIPDPLGNTVAMIDSTQTITDTFSYWPYGEIASRTGDTPTLLRFIGTLGYHYDSPTRFYVRARYHFPCLSRWGSLDPLGFGAGDLNLYRYCDNNPSSLSDPTGLATLLEGIIGALVGCGVNLAISEIGIFFSPTKDPAAKCKAWVNCAAGAAAGFGAGLAGPIGGCIGGGIGALITTIGNPICDCKANPCNCGNGNSLCDGIATAIGAAAGCIAGGVKSIGLPNGGKITNPYGIGAILGGLLGVILDRLGYTCNNI